MIDLKKIEKYDINDCYSSTQNFYKQIKQVISDVEKIRYSNEYRNCDLVAISGMGGSIYSYHIIKSIFCENLKKPLVMINGYRIPKYVLNDTLFLGVSYSGNTEETVSTLKEAIKNKDAATAVFGGGEIEKIIKQHKLPGYHFSAKFNPCNAPRIGLGYTIFGPIMILSKLGYLDIDKKILLKAISALQKNDKLIQEKAYSDAQKIKGKMVMFISTNHLQGNVHIARNQMNETAKTFSEFHLIPELNHHLLEGLKYPKNENIVWLFFNSQFSHDRNKKRIKITQDVLKQHHNDYIEVNFDVKNKYEELLFFLSYGSYLSLFLGIENKENPTTNPWVDYFKNELNK